MLFLTNHELRLFLLQHLTARIGKFELSTLQNTGLRAEHLTCLGQLSAL